MTKIHQKLTEKPSRDNDPIITTSPDVIEDIFRECLEKTRDQVYGELLEILPEEAITRVNTLVSGTVLRILEPAITKNVNSATKSVMDLCWDVTLAALDLGMVHFLETMKNGKEKGCDQQS